VAGFVEDVAAKRMFIWFYPGYFGVIIFTLASENMIHMAFVAAACNEDSRPFGRL